MTQKLLERLLQVEGRKMKNILEGGLGLLITALSGDLLYLYYGGGWIEPITWVRYSEIIMLYGFCLMGIIFCALKVKGLARS